MTTLKDAIYLALCTAGKEPDQHIEQKVLEYLQKHKERLSRESVLLGTHSSQLAIDLFIRSLSPKPPTKDVENDQNI